MLDAKSVLNKLRVKSGSAQRFLLPSAGAALAMLAATCITVSAQGNDAKPAAKSSVAAPSTKKQNEATKQKATEQKEIPSKTTSTNDEFMRPRRVLLRPAASDIDGDNSASRETTELEELRAEIKDAENERERARLQRTLVDRLVESTDKNKAATELGMLTSEDRFDPALFYNIGNALAHLGDTNAAIEAYRKAISQRRGDYALAQNNLGVLLIRLGRWEEAHEALEAALRLENFSYAEASYNMGRLHALRGEAKLAIKEWQRTLKMEPDHTNAVIALARAYAEDGNPQRGISLLDTFSARFARRGASAPREVVIAHGEIVAVTNVNTSAEETNRGNGRSSETVPAKVSGADNNRSEMRLPAPL